MREIALPKGGEVGANEMLVRVKAAGVNPIDYKIRKNGLFKAGAGTVLGFDIAGVVEKVGAGVRDFVAGDAVYYSPEFSTSGGYAEFQVVDAGIVAHKPASLSFVEAAAVPVAGMTAWDGVMTRGAVKLGETVLVSAANGGVGSIAVQLAKAAGAWVFATCSTRSMDFVKGAPIAPHRVLNYQTEDWAEAVGRDVGERRLGGLDMVFDCAGGDVVSRSIGLMRPLGRIVTIVNPSGKLDEAYRKNVAIHYEFLQRKRETLERLTTVIERGQLKVPIDSVMGLEEAGAAQRKLEAGGVRGKIVLEVG